MLPALVAEGYALGFDDANDLLWLHILMIVSHDDLRLETIDADVDYTVDLGDLAQGFGNAAAAVAPRAGEVDKSNSCFCDRHREIPVVGEPEQQDDISIGDNGDNARICGVR